MVNHPNRSKRPSRHDALVAALRDASRCLARVNAHRYIVVDRAGRDETNKSINGAMEDAAKTAERIDATLRTIA